MPSVDFRVLRMCHFNAQYSDDQEYSVPESDDVIRIWNEMRETETNTHITKPARFVARISRIFLDSLEKYQDYFFRKVALHFLPL